MDQGLAAILGAGVGAIASLVTSATVSYLAKKTDLRKLEIERCQAHTEWLRQKVAGHIDSFVDSLLKWLLEDWTNEQEGQAMFFKASVEATRIGHLMTIYADRKTALEINEKLDLFIRARSATMAKDYSKVFEAPKIKDEIIRLLSGLMHNPEIWGGNGEKTTQQKIAFTLP